MLLIIWLQPMRAALMAFVIALGLISSLIAYTEYEHVEYDRAEVLEILDSRLEVFKDDLTQSLSTANTLASLVQVTQANAQTLAAVTQFMASMSPASVPLALAPDGIIRYQTAALAQNLHGINLLQHPDFAPTAQASKRSAQMLLSPPVASAENSWQILGLLPIFLPNPAGSSDFWGFANVVLHFPQDFGIQHLPLFAGSELIFELLVEDTHQYVAQHLQGSVLTSGLQPVQTQITVANTVWTLSAAPAAGWQDPKRLWLKLAAGALVSLLLAVMLQWILQRKQQQLALEAEVRRMSLEILPLKNNLEAILHVSPDLLCEMDIDGHCYHCYCPDESLLPQHIQHLRQLFLQKNLAPDIAAVILPALQEAYTSGFTNGKQLSFELNALAYYFELAVAYRADAFKPRFILLARDITRTVNDAKSLAASELKLRAIIDNQPECVKLIDQDGVLLEMNASGLAMIEADNLEQVLGKNILGLVNSEYLQAFKKFNHKIFQGEPGCFEFEITSLKGNQLWLRSQSVPFRDTQGRIVAALSVTSNITQQKQLEFERQYTNTLLNVTLDATDEGLLVVSTTGKILLVNRRFYQLWHIPDALENSQDDEALLGSVLEQLVDPEQFLSEVRRLYNSDLEAHDILHFKDGRVIARFSRRVLINEIHGRIWCFKDISEQHQAQVALSAREEIYRSIVTQAADGIVLVDVKTKKFAEFNEAACAQLGYSRAEFEQMTLHDIQGEFDFAGVETKVHEIIVNGHGDFNTLHRHKDGTLRNVRVSNRVIYLHEKMFFAAILSDITELMRIQQALRQKDRYQRALLDNFPFMIWLKDTESRYLAVNKVFLDAAGVSSFNAIIGKTDFDVWPATLAKSYREDDAEVLLTRSKKNLEEKIAVQGEVKWFETYKAPVLDADSQLLGTVGFARDISDRKYIEEELRSNRERLDFALKGSNDGFWDWNLETDSVYYSPIWKSMLGYEEHELENNLATWLQLTDPEQNEIVLLQALDYVNGKNNTFEVEMRMQHKQGHWVDILSRAKLAVDEAGKPLIPKRLIGTHVDITERKRVSEALAASTALLNSILNNIPLRVFWKDKQSRYLGSNEAFARDAGMRVDELIGKDDTQLVWQAQAAIYKADDLQVLQSETPKLSYDEPQTNANGTQSWLRTSKVPLRNNAGEVIGVLGIYEDITRYKQAEQDLLESETRFRKLFEDTAEATLLLEGGSIVDANASALRLLGMQDVQQIMNRKLTDFSPQFQIDGQLSSVVFEQLSELLAEHSVQQLEWELIQQHGEHIVAELLITPILYQKRQMLHIVLRDITVRKQMEVALRRSEESLNRAQSIGHVGSWLIRFDTDEFECSVETHRIFGIAPHQKINFDIFVENIYPVDRERFLLAWRSALNGEKILNVEHRLLVEGVIRWVRERAEIEFGDKNQAVLAIGTVQEITQQKLIETELEQHRFHLENLVNLRTSELEEAMQAAETANRAKSTFLANMSHEIRTPMNAIIGLTHLLRKDISNPKHRAQLLKVGDAAQHLLSIINDVLDLSKIEAGKFNMEYIRFSPIRIVDHVMSMLGERAAVKGLFFRCEVETTLPRLLMGDPFRLQQVLLNFVNNAVKFSDQGTIIIRVKSADMPTKPGRIAVCFEVEDEGIGLSKEQQSRLFKAFVQADDSTTRKYGGTGLGLAIIKRIADMMDGQAGVESELGVGSRFWMIAQLGLCDQDTYEESVIAPNPDRNLDTVLKQHFSGVRILVAEDDPVNQEVAKELLLDAGFIVDLAANGVEVMELLQNGDYALVLMDMQMPIMDGIETTFAIRKLPNKAALPIIAMTANAFEEDRQLCLHAGMNDHIGKPVDPEKLYQVLLRWLPAVTFAKPPAVIDTLASDDYLQILEQIPYLDVSIGLRAVRGNLLHLANLLKIFVETHQHDMALIREHINKAEYQDARRIVHTLKGITATLGAPILQQAAMELESKFTEHTDGKQLLLELKPFAKLWEPFISNVDSAVQTVLSAIKQPQQSAYNVSQAGKVLWELEELLAQDDTKVNGLLLEAEGLIDTVLGADAELLKRYINEFRYDQALTHLRKILPGLELRSKV